MSFKSRLSLVLLFAWFAVPAFAQTPVTDKLSVKRDSLVTIKAASVPEGASVDWEVIPDTVTYAPNQPAGQLVFNGPPGTYKVRLDIIDWKAEKRTKKTYTVTIEGQPEPPPPDPDKPQSELAKTFQTAYNQDKDAAALASFQKAMSQAVTLCKDTKYTSVDALVSAINTNTKALVPAGKLAPLGVEVGKYLGTQLPTSDKPLNQDDRAHFVNTYTTVSKALAELKP